MVILIVISVLCRVLKKWVQGQEDLKNKKTRADYPNNSIVEIG